MKIRNGFVSNSSSSSFVVTVTEQAHQQALAKVAPWEREIILKGFMDRKTQILQHPGGGLEVRCGGYYSDAGGGCTLDWAAEKVNFPEEILEGKMNEDSEDYDEDFVPGFSAVDHYLKEVGEGEYVSTDVGDGG
jgi:hypothetical protein